MTHRLIERLELQITHKLAMFIKSRETEPVHPLNNPQELDPPADPRRVIALRNNARSSGGFGG
jgi:hypothetical protein